ncbi:hypothetical protein Y032_0097g3023 [Ancylostoma ceylanicum]|uniref:Uncharacterized protein n=1 Tax=Ancylostoma ceylanicum TaxID=53326 RepID=A0A016TIX4_9BILA|nr:hypothetical protein Y032_0097g3023 [Ancylostoma ceylanicum]
MKADQREMYIPNEKIATRSCMRASELRQRCDWPYPSSYKRTPGSATHLVQIALYSRNILGISERIRRVTT